MASFLRTFLLRPLRNSGNRFLKVKKVDISTSNVVQTIRNDPFVKLSISLLAIALGGTAALEAYNKFGKKKTASVSVFPPSFSHHSVKRAALIKAIDFKFQGSNSADKGIPVMCLTGPAGCGKTQILYQFSAHFIASHQHKWLGLRRVYPAVVYLDASSTDSLKLSVSVALKALGLKEGHQPEANVSAMMYHLQAQEQPWLLMVDGCPEAMSSDSSLVTMVTHLKQGNGKLGCAIWASHAHIPAGILGDLEISVPPRLSEEEACELMLTQGQVEVSSETRHLLQTLQCHPFSVALAAATISTYQSFHQCNSSTATESYSKLLTESISTEHCPFQAALRLYIAVASNDIRMRHTFDLIGSLNVNSPVPAMAVTHHLKNAFYDLPEESLAEISSYQTASTEFSYWDYLKSVKEYFLPASNLPVNSANVRDDIFFLRNCPLFSFVSYLKGFEFIRAHDSAANSLRLLFTGSTCAKFDEDYCRVKQNEFQQNTWKYRSFNKKDSLASYYRSLPGLSSPGVFTARQYSSISYESSDVAQGTSVPENMSYPQYVHIVSHYHRVFNSLECVYLNVSGDMSAWVLQNLLKPHFIALQNYPHVAQSDRLAVQILAADVHVALLSPHDLKSYLPHYKHLVDEQLKILGSQSLTVASAQTKYADMLLSLGRPSEARTILQGVLSIYKKLSPNMRDQMCMDIGHCMSALGRTYAQLGDYSQSRDWFEHAMASYQTLPEQQGKATKKQQRLVSNSLIDVAHSYLVLGDLAIAKKYSDLACMVLDSLHPEGTAETVRILQIGSVIHSLMGDKEESMKQQARASKIEAKL